MSKIISKLFNFYKFLIFGVVLCRIVYYDADRFLKDSVLIGAVVLFVVLWLLNVIFREKDND